MGTRSRSRSACAAARRSGRGDENFSIIEAGLDDESGSILAVWYNRPYLEKTLTPGRPLLVFGRAELDRRGRLVLQNADYELVDDADARDGVHTGRIVPVYRRLGELGSKALRTIISAIVQQLDAKTVPELVPGDVAGRFALPPRARALAETHFPPENASLDELSARTTPALAGAQVGAMELHRHVHFGMLGLGEEILP